MARPRAPLPHHPKGPASQLQRVPFAIPTGELGTSPRQNPDRKAIEHTNGNAAKWAQAAARAIISDFSKPPLTANREYPIICAVTNEWIVEFTDEFELWWLELSEIVQEKCAAIVDLLTREGPNLGFPYSSSIKGSAHALRELRIQCGGHP